MQKILSLYNIYSLSYRKNRYYGSFVIFAPRLDGLRPVDLLQHHDPGQMMGEGHFAHGELEIRLVLDLLADAEGGTDQEGGAALSGILHILQLPGKFLRGEDFSLRGENAQPGIFGDLLEDQLRFLVEARLDLGRGGVLGKPVLGKLDDLKGAVALQPLLVFLGGGEVDIMTKWALSQGCKDSSISANQSM